MAKSNISKDAVFVYLAQQKDFVPDVAIAGELGLGMPQVKKFLSKLGDAVENDGDGNWRAREGELSKGLDSKFKVAPVDSKAPLLPPRDLIAQGNARGRVVPEIVQKKEDQLSDEEQKEFLRRERRIEKAIAVFYQIGEDLKYINENRLYRSQYKDFADYVKNRWGLRLRQAYHLISSFEVFANLKNLHNCAKNEPTFVLPTAEYQVRSLAKLEPEEQVEIWKRAIAQNNGKIPTGQRIQELVKEKKMERSKRYNTQVERFKVGDVVRITSKYNTNLKQYHFCWGQILSVEEHSYTVDTYKGSVSEIAHDDLMALSRSSKEATKSMLERLQKAFELWPNDPDAMAILHYFGTKANPGCSEAGTAVLDALTA